MLPVAAEQHLAVPPVAHCLREQRVANQVQERQVADSGAPRVLLPVRAEPSAWTAHLLDSDDSELLLGAPVPGLAPGRDTRLEGDDSPRPGSAAPGSLAQTERDSSLHS